MAARKTGLIVLGALSALLYFALSALGPAPQQLHRFWMLFGSLFLLYLVAFWAIKSTRIEGKDLRTFLRANWRSLAVIFGFALLFRMIMLWSFPQLSDDIYRYLWDGRVWNAGINPYQHAPAAAALTSLRDDTIYPFINHKSIPTIYPPLLQVLFRGLNQFSGGLYAAKGMVVLFDLGVMVLLLLMLYRFRKSGLYVLLYAWNPLILVEFAGSGHVDVIGVFFLLLAFLLFSYRRFVVGAAALAAAILIKLVPVLLLPFLWLRQPKRRALMLTLGIAAVCFFAYLPFSDAGSHLTAALATYTQKWRFNGSIFELLYHPVHQLIPESHLRHLLLEQHLTPTPEAMASTRVDVALQITKLLLAAVFALFYLAVMRDMRGRNEPTERQLPRVWLLVFGALLLLSATVHPWYLAWILPLLALYSSAAFLYLSASLVLSYAVLETYYLQGIWQESLWVRLMIYVPFYLLLIREWTPWILRYRRRALGEVRIRREHVAGLSAQASKAEMHSSR